MSLIKELQSLSRQATVPNEKEVKSIVRRITERLKAYAKDGKKEMTLNIHYRNGRGGTNFIYYLSLDDSMSTVRESCHRQAFSEAIKDSVFDGIKILEMNPTTYMFSWSTSS